MVTPTWSIRPARALDLPAVVELLESAGLPLAGLGATSLHVAIAGDATVGVVGIERRDHAALLRSLAVDPGARGAGLGRHLVEHALAVADSEGAREVHLLTTTAADWFVALGFTRIDRADLPAPLLASAELQGACPDSAEVLVRPTGGGAP